MKFLTAAHEKIVDSAIAERRDPHVAVAEHFGITRAEAKEANFRLLYRAPVKGAVL